VNILRALKNILNNTCTSKKLVVHLHSKTIRKMKKILILLLSTGLVTAQEINFNLLVDRTAHIVTEIEGVEKHLYVKQSLEYAPQIEGGYFATGTAVGYTMELGLFRNYRIYTAPKVQFIVRGGNVYPSYGAEIGVDKTYWSGLILGIRATNDYRTDFDFWGGEASWQPSLFVKIGWKIK
jgi:hypothetical protein